MNILFLGYWNADDPLTSATILPHLRILKKVDKINEIVFVCTQREEVSEERVKEIQSIGVIFNPIYSRNFPVNLFNKINDFYLFPKQLIKLTAQYKIQLIIARGAPAGGLAYLVWKKKRIPFVVESYEPHAAYMLVTKTWKRYDPRFLYQSYLEARQKKHATSLVTVSENYRKALEDEGIDKNKLFTAPCLVDQKKFFPDANLRNVTRQELKIPEDAIVGVYAGKFGGLYFENEAFEIFQAAFKYFKKFYLLLLSSQKRSWIQDKILGFDLPEERCVHLFVPHDLVNKYLNAADFAFALYKETSVAKFLSPVKVGEYWAVGLPVILTEGVGDENLLMKNFGGGALYKSGKSEKAIQDIERMLPLNSKDLYVNLSAVYRSKKDIEVVYKKVIEFSIV